MIGFNSRDIAIVSSLICVLYDVGDVGDVVYSHVWDLLYFSKVGFS